MRNFLDTMLKSALVTRALITFLFAAAAISSAETIHLKNGRTIAADNVREKDDKVEYQVGDDTYRIPKALVEKIDTSTTPLVDPNFGNVTPAARPKSDTQHANPPMPSEHALKMPSNKDVMRVVHDGKVDLDALGDLESSNNQEAAAAGYFVAGRFEFERGDRENAQHYFERALGFSPDNPAILANYAALLVQMGRAREAVNFAEHAVQNAPDSADAYSVLGYAYFSSDRTRDAVPAWQKSIDLRPDKKIDALLVKAKRELAAEANYREHDTGHFTLRYEGSATKDTLRQQITSTLEKDYDDLSSQLGITPYQNIPVVLYTEQAFFDVTQAPTWTGAINDGKLRIPIQGVDYITPELARVLKHELAHSFINQASTGRCPQWLNEGIAQVAEGRTLTGPRGPRMAIIYNAKAQVPLRELEKSFMNFTRSKAVLAYEESLAATLYIRDTYGMADIQRVLERLSQGGTLEDAFRDVLRVDYDQFERDLTSYLATRYGT